MDQFFNDSTGTGDEGEIDTRGPWNEGGDWEFMASPALSATDADAETEIRTESSPPTAPEGINELLVDELRDILHAEKQLTKALPKMAEAARFDRLRECFEEHLIETEGQIERLNECFSLLGETARAKPCKGMMGLVEEGQEVMAEGEEKEDALADLALIGAAQRVEHYEISAYTTAKNLAQQLRHSAVVALLAKSLAEEENADMLLNQIARTPHVRRQNARRNRTECRRGIDIKTPGPPHERGGPFFLSPEHLMLFLYPMLTLMIDALNVIDMRLRLIAAGKSTSDEDLSDGE